MLKVFRAFADKLHTFRAGTEPASAFPAETFWRTVSWLRSPILLVKGEGLQVIEATDESFRLFGSSSYSEISNYISSGMDPYARSRIQRAVENPAAIVADLAARITQPERTLHLSVTVVPLPEYPAQGAALLMLKDTVSNAETEAQVLRDLMSRLLVPAWVINESGAVSFSNAAFQGFPLSVIQNGIRDVEELFEPQEWDRLKQIQDELVSTPDRVRGALRVGETTYDLGGYGVWRALYFPLIGRGMVEVGVIATRQDGTSQGGALAAHALTAGRGPAAQLQLQQVREAERTALAREIHDSIGQDLTVLKIAVRRLQTQVVGSTLASGPVLEQLSAIWQMVESLVTAARRVAFDMREDVVAANGLAHVAQELVLDLRERLLLDIQLQVQGDWVEPERERAHHMHRCLQELLTNVAKHAKASRCLVQIGFDSQAYWLEVRDDGVGIQGAVSPRSSGMRNLTERTGVYGGTIAIKSRPEVDGTVFRLTFPGPLPGK